MNPLQPGKLTLVSLRNRRGVERQLELAEEGAARVRAEYSAALSRDAREAGLADELEELRHPITTVPVEASFTYAMSGALESPAGRAPVAFSVTCRIVGAAATAATAAAPTAVFFRKLRRDMPASSSAMFIPSVLAGGAEPLLPRPRRPRTGAGSILSCVTSAVTIPVFPGRRRAASTQRPHAGGCRGRDLDPRPPDASGAPRSNARRNPMSPTLPQAEPPRRAAEDPARYKACDACRSRESSRPH